MKRKYLLSCRWDKQEVARLNGGLYGVECAAKQGAAENNFTDWSTPHFQIALTLWAGVIVL